MPNWIRNLPNLKTTNGLYYIIVKSLLSLEAFDVDTAIQWEGIMDRLAAALAVAIGIFILLIWRQFVKVTPIPSNLDIQGIVLVGVLIVGLTVYIRIHAHR